jgi:suppressor of fused-like protein
VAIDAHVERADGNLALRRFRPRTPGRFSRRGPLEEVAAYWLAGSDAHWHLITYGLSELYAKETLDRHRSGFGFELTFRWAPPDAAEPEEPHWAVDMLTSLAGYVWSGGEPFESGDQIDLRGPIRLGADTPITAAVVVEDPGLSPLDGPFGRVDFLQVVGVTADELELCRAWSTEAVVETLAGRDPLLVTRLDRGSFAEEIGHKAVLAAQGPNEELGVSTLSVRRGRRGGAIVEMGSGAAAALGQALRRSLRAPSSTFRLVGHDEELYFRAGEAPSWSAPPGFVEVVVPLDQVPELAALFDGNTGWGRRPQWSGLRFHVVK